MIKGAGELADGTPFVMIGLTGENWDMLRGGVPITINLPGDMPEHADKLPTLQVVFLGGETEATIHDELRAMGWTRDR